MLLVNFLSCKDDCLALGYDAVDFPLHLYVRSIASLSDDLMNKVHPRCPLVVFMMRREVIIGIDAKNHCPCRDPMTLRNSMMI